MKYKTIIFDKPFVFTDVVIDLGNDSFTEFPATVGNSAYDAFLVDAQLTDSQVKALKPDTWYDFPKETK